MQIQSDAQPLFPRHPAILVNLLCQSGFSIHSPTYPFCASFAQVSLSVMVRLKMS
jgi:hypothetical protein